MIFYMESYWTFEKQLFLIASNIEGNDEKRVSQNVQYNFV